MSKEQGIAPEPASPAASTKLEFRESESCVWINRGTFLLRAFTYVGFKVIWGHLGTFRVTIGGLVVREQSSFLSLQSLEFLFLFSQKAFFFIQIVGMRVLLCLFFCK